MSSGSGRRSLAAVVLVVAGGLALAGSATAGWVTETETVEIGDVPVTETDERAGTAFAPLAVAFGVGAAVVALPLAAVTGRPRRILGGLITLIGIGALVEIGLGARAALAADGALGTGPGVGAVGAAAVVGGGVLALRGDPPPRLSERFDLDADASPDEWSLTSEDDEGADDFGRPGDVDPSEAGDADERTR